MNEIFLIEEPGMRQGDVGSYFQLGTDGIVDAIHIVRDVGAIWDVKPFMKLPEDQTRELIQGFLDVARDEGMKPHNESHTEGKLEATSKHLEDMRTLVFKNDEKKV